MTTSLNADTNTAISRLTMAELDWAADFLSNVFLVGTPIAKLFFPPDIARKLRYFMKCNCALALNTGECYTTAARDGIALWLPPGKSSMSLVDMWNAGMFWAPVEYGLRGTAKVIGFARHIEVMHKRHAPMPHYYLFLTGVDPKQQRQGISAALIGNMLERIDAEKMPVYLETQSAGNVEVYQKLGFEMVEKRAFPFAPDIFNWGMLRRPKTNGTFPNLGAVDAPADYFEYSSPQWSASRTLYCKGRNTGALVK